MRTRVKRRISQIKCESVWLLSLLFCSQLALAELPAEQIPNTETLPAEYPDTWVFAHDANFASLLTGRVVILDVAAETREYKGALDAAQFATFIESSERSELYVAETFYSRGTRGERTDAVTIYDKASLKVIDEIILPGGKRAQIVTNKFALRLIDDDKFLLVFNFTPASTVTVIDIGSRAILNEIAVPGCSMIYPSGKRGFSTLCGDGALQSFELDKKGKVAAQHRLDKLFDIDADPLFDKPVYIGNTAYFPSFLGDIQTVKMTGKPKVQERWSMLADEDIAENWRPSGWQIISADQSRLYVLMQKNGTLGSHKNGGEEVWVFDPSKKKRLQRIALENGGFSIQAVSGGDGYLVVTEPGMDIAVYDLKGNKLRIIGGAAAMPLILHAQR